MSKTYWDVIKLRVEIEERSWYWYRTRWEFEGVVLGGERQSRTKSTTWFEAAANLIALREYSRYLQDRKHYCPWMHWKLLSDLTACLFSSLLLHILKSHYYSNMGNFSQFLHLSDERHFVSKGPCRLSRINQGALNCLTNLHLFEDLYLKYFIRCGCVCATYR